MEDHTLEERARKIWIDGRNIRNIPRFADLHKGSINRWLRKIRQVKNDCTIIDLVDICDYFGFPIQRIIVFFEH